MLKILCIGLGGGLGAIARYSLTTLINHIWISAFPLGTLLANFLGAVFMGAFTQWAAKYEITASLWLPFLTTGLLGGFTTFSTFSLETVNLMEQGQWLLAVCNILFSISLCLLGIFLGKYLIKLWF